MTPERQPSSAPDTSVVNLNLPHSGNAEGRDREEPFDETIESVQNLNTNQIEQAAQALEHSGELVLTDEERAVVLPQIRAMRRAALQQQESQPTVEATEQTDEPAVTAGFVPTGELTTAPEKKKGKKVLFGALGAAAATAVAAASLYLLPKGENSTENKGPAPTGTVATATAKAGEATPGKGEVSKSTDGEVEPFTVESMQIPAGLSPEEFGKAYVGNRLNRTIAAGATKENQARFLANPTQTLLNSIASQNTFISAPALYGPDWQKDPAIAEFVKNEEADNATFLRMWYQTKDAPLGNGDIAFTETFVASNTTLISTNPDGGRTLSIDGNQYNNANKNSIGAQFPRYLQLNGKSFTITVTTKVVNGKEYVTKFKSVATS